MGQSQQCPCSNFHLARPQQQPADATSPPKRGKANHCLKPKENALHEHNNRFIRPVTTRTANIFARSVATIYAWQHLKEFRGEPERFYSWLNRICYTASIDGLRSNRRESKSKLPLFVEIEEEDGSVSFEDNPILYAPDDPIAHRRKLPEFITGTDLEICQYIREGYNYAKISEILSLTAPQVEKRVRKMRRKIQAVQGAPSRTE